VETLLLIEIFKCMSIGLLIEIQTGSYISLLYIKYQSSIFVFSNWTKGYFVPVRKMSGLLHCPGIEATRTFITDWSTIEWVQCACSINLVLVSKLTLITNYSYFDTYILHNKTLVNCKPPLQPWGNVGT
jgi:hypothetical protein